MKFEEVVKKALLLISLSFLVVAIAGLYISANQLIDLWAGYRYAPLFKILLNLGVALVAVYAISTLLRR